MGTDLAGLAPGVYVPALLPINVEQNGRFTLKQITPCTQFLLPSSSGDPYFTGADTELTTKDEYEGNITSRINRNAGRRQTDFSIEGLRVQLKGEGIKNSSTIEDEFTHTFRTSIKVDLTTQETDPDSDLSQITTTPPVANLDEAEQQELFRFSQRGNNYVLRGSSLNEGKIILVGIGLFDNLDNNFIGSDTGRSFLIEDPAYIYIQLEAEVCGVRP